MSHLPREVAVVGLMRSGLHAIATWLAAQDPVRSFFINDVLAKEWKSSPFGPEGLPEECKYIVYTMEDVTLKEAKKRLFEARRVLPVYRQEPTWVVVLRDPYNTFASRLKYTGTLHKGRGLSKEALEAWKTLARSYLSTRILYTVNFNRWFDNLGYRACLSKTLNLSRLFRDVQRQYVSEYGLGSSFDGMKYQGRASQMRVLDRWKEYWNDATFRNFFDKETREISDTLFGKVVTNE